MDTKILFIISTALLIVMFVAFRQRESEIDHIHQLVGYKNAEGNIVLGNDQRKWGDWKLGDPSYVLLYDRSSLDQNLQPCPAGTYGPTCNHKMCNLGRDSGFYSYSQANTDCKNLGFTKCNTNIGECE